MNVKFVSITQPVPTADAGPATPGPTTAEELIVYTARVSNPSNQNNFETAPKLLSYLIRNKHWSPFEMVDMTVEIETSRAIAAQILRHRSFSFQEFSQRYSAATLGYEPTTARRQDTKNRQASHDDLPEETKVWFETTQGALFYDAEYAYQKALGMGIAKECARMLLPLSTTTRLYMKGSARSWLHYLQVRTDPGTQAEHREVAEAVAAIFAEQFPFTAAALVDVSK